MKQVEARDAAERARRPGLVLEVSGVQAETLSCVILLSFVQFSLLRKQILHCPRPNSVSVSENSVGETSGVRRPVIHCLSTLSPNYI